MKRSKQSLEMIDEAVTEIDFFKGKLERFRNLLGELSKRGDVTKYELESLFKGISNLLDNCAKKIDGLKEKTLKM